MYLNQLGLKAKSDKMSIVRNSRKLNGRNEEEDDDNENEKIPELKLPAKKKIRDNGNGYQESIYDCLPKPRSCLREDQVNINQILN
jgi:hypothetical protein